MSHDTIMTHCVFTFLKKLTLEYKIKIILQLQRLAILQYVLDFQAMMM
jgi:hypothetical protein